MKSHPSLRGQLSSALAMLALTLVSTVIASAATYTWTGGSQDWNTAGNWNTSSVTVPGAGDTAYFNGTANDSSPITFTSGAASLGNLTFDTSSVGAYIIGLTTDPVLTLSSGGTIQTTSSVANVETVNVPITLGGSATFSSNSSTTADTLNFGGAITLSTSGTLTLAGTNTGANTISGVITGGGASNLLMSSGAWTLSGASTSYTGTTTLGGGTLTLNGNTGSLGATSKVVGNGGTFIYSNSGSGAQTQSLGAVTASSGDTTIENIESGSGTSTLTLASTTRSTGGAVNYTASGTGASIVSTAALAPGTVVGNGIFYNGANYAVATAGGSIGAPVYTTSGTYRDTADNSNAINGAASWLVNSNSVATSANLGLGTIAFNGSYTLSTGTIFAGGILVSGGQATISAQFRVTTSFANNQDLVIRTNSSSDSLTLSGGLNQGTSGVAVGLTKVGSGTLTISNAANSYGGTTYVDEGTLNAQSSTALGFGNTNNSSALVGTAIVQSGATLNIGAAATALKVNKAITLNGGILTNSTTGTTTIDNGVSGVQFTTGGSSYTGTSLIFNGGVAPSGGSLATGSDAVTSGAVTSVTTTAAGSGYTSAPTVTVAGGTGFNGTAILSSVTLNGTANQIGGSGALIINAAIADGTSSGGFTKNGTDTVTLTGANTYTGGTTVTGGVLNATQGSSAGTGGMTVNAATTLAIGKAAGAASFATLTPATLTLNTATGTGNEAILKLDLGSAATSDEISTGAFNLVGGTVFNLQLTETAGLPASNETLLTWTSGTGVTNVSQVDLTGSTAGITNSNLLISGDNLIFLGAVPEPGPWALLLAGSGLLLPLIRRRFLNSRAS